MISSVANGGKLLQPHVLLQSQGADRKPQPAPVVGQARGVYTAVTLGRPHQGVRAAVERGPAGATNLKQVAVAGKTGSAENPRGKPHAWFAGYAPVGAPRVAVVAVVEHGFPRGARRVFRAPAASARETQQ